MQWATVRQYRTSRSECVGRYPHTPAQYRTSDGSSVPDIAKTSYSSIPYVGIEIMPLASTGQRIAKS
eukprot:703046-Rhodomonas_salina.2